MRGNARSPSYLSPLTSYLSPFTVRPRLSEPAPIRVTFKRRGTILIEGVVEVRDENGHVVPQPPAKHQGVIKLCGCGHSATKPFCDGSHKQFMGSDKMPANGS